MAARGVSSKTVARFTIAFDLRRFASGRNISLAVPWLVLLLGLVAYHQIYTVYRFDTPVHGDGEGYYAYLPAYLLYGDPSLATVIRDHLIPAYAALGHQAPSQFGLTLQSTGNWLDQYGIGVAVLLLPFFAIGHVIAILGGSNANGYSLPETFAVGTAAIVYATAGLLILRAVLARWFPHWTIAVTLVAIVFGTSLFDFTTWDSVASHAFSFFALSLALLLTLRWYDKRTLWRAAAVGMVAGVMVDIRLSDIVLLLALPLLAVGSAEDLRVRARLLWERRRHVLLTAGCIVLLFVPQSITWRIATGHFLINSYGQQSFDWLHPRMLESLGGFKPHGLLPYAPVLLLSFIGTGVAWFRQRDVALPVTVAFLPFWYVIASWYDWSYSAAFGQRGFIDVLPLLAIPMAYLLSLAKGWVARVGIVGVTGLLTAVTCTLMLAYWQYHVPGDGVHVSSYLAILRHPTRVLGPPAIPSWMQPLINARR